MSKLLLVASDFQATDDPAIAFASRREGSIEDAIVTALDTIGDAADANDLHNAVLEGNVGVIAAILASSRVVDALRLAYGTIADTFIAAAENEAEAKFGGLVVYDPIVAAAELAGARQTFMGSILGNSAQSVADFLIASARNGADPEQIADALRYVIGLTPQQATAVANFRALLENGDSEALRRALRDRRFDATVQSWIDGTSQIDGAKVDAMVARYGERMLAHRAETIARTESLQATVGGVRSAYVQAVNSGRLLDSEVRRFWLVVPDERKCVVCGSIPLMNPKGVGVNDAYKAIIGTFMAPLAHPRCRCTERYVVNLSRVQSNPFALAA